MRAGRILLAPASAVLAALFLTLSAHAAEEGGAATAPELFKWMNFAIWAGALLWVCWKKAPRFFRARAEEIGSAISKAGSVKAAADAQLREVERIRTATRSDMEKIAVAAKAEIEAAERAARLELKAVAARLAVEGAESLLTNQLTAQTQAGLISNFVKNLEGMPH